MELKFKKKFPVAPARREPEGDVLTRGLKRGLADTVDLAQAAYGLSAGDEGYVEEQLLDMERNRRKTVRGDDTSRFSDIDGLGSALNWAGGTLGEFGADIATALTGAGLAATAAKGALKAGVSGTLKAAAAGGMATSFPAQMGEVATGMYSEKGRIVDGDAAIAAGAATVMSALEIAPFMRLLGKGMSPVDAADGILSRIGKESLRQAGVEGLTEGVQEAINIAALDVANEHRDSFGVDDIRDIIDATAAGALGGGVIGGIGAGIKSGGVGGQGGGTDAGSGVGGQGGQGGGTGTGIGAIGRTYEGEVIPPDDVDSGLIGRIGDTHEGEVVLRELPAPEPNNRFLPKPQVDIDGETNESELGIDGEAIQPSGSALQDMALEEARRVEPKIHRYFPKKQSQVEKPSQETRGVVGDINVGISENVEATGVGAGADKLPNTLPAKVRDSIIAIANAPNIDDAQLQYNRLITDAKATRGEAAALKNYILSLKPKWAVQSAEPKAKPQPLPQPLPQPQIDTETTNEPTSNAPFLPKRKRKNARPSDKVANQPVGTTTPRVGSEPEEKGDRLPTDTREPVPIQRDGGREDAVRIGDAADGRERRGGKEQSAPRGQYLTLDATKEYVALDDVTDATGRALKDGIKFSRGGSRSGMSEEAAREAIDRAIGKGASSNVKFYRADDGTNGYTKDGVVHINLSAVDADNVVAIYLHEASGHGGLQEMLGDAYDALIEAFERLLNTGDATASRAANRVPDDTPEAHVAEERIAYTIEEFLSQRATPSAKLFVRRVLAKVKAFIISRVPKAARYLGLNAADIAELAVLAARSNRTKRGAGVRYSRTGTSGSAAANVHSPLVKLYRRTKTFVKEGGLATLTIRQIADIYGDKLSSINNYLETLDLMRIYRNKLSSMAGEIVTRWEKLPRAERERMARLMHDSTLNDAIDQTEYNALSADARRVFDDVRNHYEYLYNLRIGELKARIINSSLGVSERSKLLAELDARLGAAKRSVYFPLFRQGDFAVRAKTPNGEPFFALFATMDDATEAAQQLRAQGFTDVAASKKHAFTGKDAEATLAALSGVMAQLKASGKKVDDEIYQLYLSLLPELSMRKYSIHRKGIAGYNSDALHAFGHIAGHGASQVARLRYADKLRSIMAQLRKDADNANSDAERIEIGIVYDEMVKRHEWAMNPKNGEMANNLTAFGFFIYLGFSPAAALVNLTQTVIVALPMMIAEFGNASVGELSRAAKLLRYNGIERGKLSANERDAFVRWAAMGVIDETQTRSLIGVRDEHTPVNDAIAKVSELSGRLFQQAEVINREVTLLAAYRLAVKAGARHEDAISKAARLTWDSHFDYSNINRSRIMQGDVAKVLLLFKQYSQHMLYILLNGAYQAGKGGAAGKKAKARVLGILAITAALGGLSALPFGIAAAAMAISYGAGKAGAKGIALSAAGVIAAYMAVAFAEDEKEIDEMIREWARKTGGNALESLISRGLFNVVTGVDLSSRISLSDLVFRDSDIEYQSVASSKAEGLTTVSGAIGGYAVRVLYDAPALLGDGEFVRALEAVSPKFARDYIQAARYYAKGVTTKSGAIVVNRDDINLFEAVMKSQGFTPEKITSRQLLKRDRKNIESRIKDKRSALIERAIEAKGSERTKTLADIQRFNKQHPDVKINRKTLKSSESTRKRMVEKEESYARD